MIGDNLPWQTAEVMVADATAITPAVCQQIITNITKVTDDAFFIMNADDIVAKHEYWTKKLPRIKPFYAVKCNNHPLVLQLLNSLGCNFDCASKAEIRSVLDMGVSPDRIIFANPCKAASHIRYAASKNVLLTTFDNASELYKIRDLFPQARLVLRIRVDAVDSLCNLGLKFGVSLEAAQQLVKLVAVLQLQLVGVSFHVGSGCREPAVYERAIAAAAHVFAMAEHLQLPPLTLLDIGGGMLGDDENRSLDAAAIYIERALKQHFGVDSSTTGGDCAGVQVIAEPGRYMVQSAFTLATQVVSVRSGDENSCDQQPCYYINDGVYGAFNCILTEQRGCVPQILHQKSVDTADIGGTVQAVPSTIFGPTCDSLDTVCRAVPLAPLAVGDWLYWNDMGAYTLSTSCTFNGFPVAPVYALTSYPMYRDGLGSVFGQKGETLAPLMTLSLDTTAADSAAADRDGSRCRFISASMVRLSHLPTLALTTPPLLPEVCCVAEN